MIQVVCKEYIEEILRFPQYYVDDSEDLALLKVYDKNNIDNPTYIMIGCDEYEKYYLVVEDNDTSEDYIPDDGETLSELFEKLLNKITKQND